MSAESGPGVASLPGRRRQAAPHCRAQGSLSPRPQVWYGWWLFLLFFILCRPSSIVRCSEQQSKEKRAAQKTLKVHRGERNILKGSIIDAFSTFSCLCF